MFEILFHKIKIKQPRPFFVAALGVFMIVPFVVLFSYTSFIIQRYPLDIYSGLMGVCMHDMLDLNICSPHRSMMFAVDFWVNLFSTLGSFFLLWALILKTGMKKALFVVALLFITPYIFLLFLELFIVGKMSLAGTPSAFLDVMCKDLSFLFFNHGNCYTSLSQYSVSVFFGACFGLLLLLLWGLLSALLKYKVSWKKIILVFLSPILLFILYLLIKFWTVSTSVFPYFLCNEITYTRPGVPIIDWCFGVPGGNCPPPPTPPNVIVKEKMCIWDKKFIRMIF